MKIAFISHLDLNLYLFRLPIMKELIKNNYEVYVVCPKGKVFDKFRQFGIKAISYDIDRASLNIIKELKTIKNIKKVITQINPDIIHSFMHKPNLYANLIGHKCVINTITGLGSFFIYNDLKSRIIRSLILLGYKITTKNTKKIVFQNSDDLKLFLDKNIIPKTKAVLIKGSGIDTNLFKPVKKKDKKIVVLMIARVIRDKGVEEFIKAAELLKDKAEFWYVGEIDNGSRSAFKPDWKNIKYFGFKDNIKSILAECDIFVLPSYREGIPRTLLEAASMQKPIVTTNTAGCKDVVEDGKNGFLVPIKDHVTLAKKIKILIDNPSLREKFAKYGRQKVMQFDIKIIIQKYIDLYEGLDCRRDNV